ncbi:MAG TPA: hypothetical protein VKT82_09365 [Ktedonobacterales bacterium]|nr:hypothetical protein [Ktedonobacterales bacterium]
MDQDVVGWSTADITLLIQSLALPAVEQFVHDHPYLQQRALAGFSKRLPPNHAQRLANFLSQRAALYQQSLQELIKYWRQEKQPLCEAIEQLEQPITLEALGPLLKEHGGRDILSALHTDQRAENFGEILAALRLGIERGEIALEATAPPPEPPARPSGKLAPSGVAPSQAQAAASGSDKRRAHAAPASVVSVATLARPSGGLPHPAAPPAAPKTTIELFAALAADLQALQGIQQTIEACGAQLTQHPTADDPQTLQRTIEKLNAAHQKRLEGFARYAALEGELLKALRAETQEAEAAGQVEGLSASLPPETAPTAISDASARLQAFHQVSERLTAALTLNEQRLAALKAAPAAIETLLREIDDLEGDSGTLRERLASLKTTLPEHGSTKQVERALQLADKLREQALALRGGLLEEWHAHLLRACRDSESLLNQSLHLSADLPEITNLQKSLQNVRAFLDTPLSPNPPVPLPFPPRNISTCRQQLLQQSDQLRRALASHNPQTALAFLQGFEVQSDLSPQQLQKVGAALVGAASLHAGYSGLIWRVGATLLASLDYEAAEQFYERFGFATVATALASSLRNGDLLLGLGFAENDYLFYTDADMSSIFKHERVLDILSYNCATYTFPMLPADCFVMASPGVRRAARELLSIAEQINFPPALRLQLSAALLSAAASPEERAQAARLLIRCLIDQRQHLNAYCVWRALALEQPNLYSDATGLDALSSFIWRFTLDTHTPTAPLAALCADSSLQEASSYVPGIALALALAALVLARARMPRGEEWASFFLDMLHDHHHYLAVSDALRARLAKLSGDPADGKDSETLGKQQAVKEQFIAALAEAERRLKVSNYRFAPTKQMRNQIDAQIQPVLAALQQGNEPGGDLGDHLAEANPADLTNALIQEVERIRRQEGRDSIEGNDLKKLRKDLENVLKQLIEAAAKRARLAALGFGFAAWRAQASNGSDAPTPDQPEDHPAEYQPWENHDAMQAELRRLLSDAPQCRDLLQQALPGISLEVE